MADPRDERIDRYLAGELSGPEQRELAQAALDDPDLFDLLTTTAAMRSALVHDDRPQASPVLSGRDDDGVRRVADRRRMSMRSVVFSVGGLAAAAAVVLAFVLLSRPSSQQPSAPPPLSPGAAASGGTDPAAPATGRSAVPPVLLVSRLEDLADQPPAEFRSAQQGDRAPKQEGTVVALDDGVATIDLGSVDGLAKGSELQVFRGPSTSTVGRLAITVAFRERARGRVADADALQIGDRVRTANADYLSALSEQVTAAVSRNDLKMARTLAERAVSLAQSDAVQAGDRRRALEQLGVVEYQAAAFADAGRHLQSAQDGLDDPPAAAAAEPARILNALGAVRIASGDDTGAEAVLLLAQSHASGAGVVAAKIANNLAAAASLRGDAAKARSLYESALDLLNRNPASNAPAAAADRRVIERNLAALSEPR